MNVSSEFALPDGAILRKWNYLFLVLFIAQQMKMWALGTE